MSKLIYFFGLMILLISCEVKPQEIAYGQDACHFCKMTIVDRQHSAQLVTEKGKAFKYDAVECMMNHLKDWDNPPVKYYLVADYSNPGTLTDATTAHYLISESIPSPMGEFLTAFDSETVRDKTQSELNGEMLDWAKLQQKFQTQ